MQSFDDTGLRPEILTALEELGFKQPTPIQAKTIPHLLNSRKDMIALAQTGTGKTAAFSLPVIHQVDGNSQHIQAIILCPTRELCLQITKDIKSYSKYLKGIRTTPVYGGESIHLQLNELKRNPHIIVGTPGRVIDLIERKKLNIQNIRWLVLDEADEMLNMGFKEELDTILKETPAEKQTLLFSATMAPSVRSIANTYMKQADQISSGQENRGADNVEHHYYMVHAKDRYSVLRRIADLHPKMYGIVFCRTRMECQDIATNLMQDHYSAEPLHGELSQSQRDAVMNRFRKKQTQLLVATDVAARGIDVEDLTHVINYNLPDALESYIHRSGRTGRAGNSGVSVTIINLKESYKIRLLEKKIGKRFEQLKIPSGKDICEKQLFNLIDKILATKINEAQITNYLPAISKKLEALDRDQLIKHFISAEFNRFLSMYENAGDLNVQVSDQGNYSNGPRAKTGGPEAFRGGNLTATRFCISIGKRNRFGIKDLFGMINRQTKLRGVAIGKIDIQQDQTIFEIDQKHASTFMDCFKHADYGGIPLRTRADFGGAPQQRKSYPPKYDKKRGPRR